jgi:hypothetical protein
MNTQTATSKYKINFLFGCQENYVINERRPILSFVALRKYLTPVISKSLAELIFVA